MFLVIYLVYNILGATSFPLYQAWPKSGPRAKCGPWKNFVRPAGWFKFMKRIRPEIIWTGIRQAICRLSKEEGGRKMSASLLLLGVSNSYYLGATWVNVFSTEKFSFLKKTSFKKIFGPRKCSSHRMWPSLQKVWPPLPYTMSERLQIPKIGSNPKFRVKSQFLGHQINRSFEPKNWSWKKLG